MFNFLAAILLNYLLVEVLIAPNQQSPQTIRFDQASHLPFAHELLAGLGTKPGRSPLNLPFLLALASCAAVWAILWRSRWGYELRAVGANEKAALYGGISPGRNVMIAMTLAGAMAGLFGVNEVMGAQHRLAESAAEVDGAELIALRDAEEMERTVACGEPASPEQRGRYRRDAAYVFQVCARAVARLMPASGAHAIFREAPQQRALRDTQVMSTHIVADWDLARESYARALLDLPTEDPVF